MKRKNTPRTHFIFKLNIFKILSIFILITFIFVSPILIKTMIRINKVTCMTQYGPCGQDLQNKLDLVKSNDLKKSKEYISNLLNNDISVNNYLIQYKLTSELDVNINLKKPKFVIFDQSGKYYLIDEKGLVISMADQTNLPTIKIENQNIFLGKNIENSYVFALELLEYLSYLYSINEGVVQGHNMLVKNNEGVNIIFPLEGDIQLLIGSLRIIFSRLNDGTEGIRMEDIREIDLRYSNPVLRKYE